MEIQLLPAVSLLPETLSVLVAPEEMLARALNGNATLESWRNIDKPGESIRIWSLLLDVGYRPIEIDEEVC
jgi:hypothetical protein